MYNYIVLEVPLKNIIHLKHESHIVLNTIVVENISSDTCRNLVIIPIFICSFQDFGQISSVFSPKYKKSSKDLPRFNFNLVLFGSSLKLQNANNVSTILQPLWFCLLANKKKFFNHERHLLNVFS